MATGLRKDHLTTPGRVAQLVRACALQAQGSPFESGRDHFSSWNTGKVASRTGRSARNFIAVSRSVRMEVGAEKET